MDLRGDLGEVASFPREELAHPRRPGRRGVGAKKLDPGPECRGTLCFGTAAEVGHRPLLAGQDRELLRGTGLPDAGLAAQKHQASASLGGGAKRAVEVAEELPSPDEGRAQELGPVRDLGHLGDETQPSAANRLDDRLTAPVALQHSPDLMQGLVEGVIGHHGVRPYLGEQLPPGNDACPAANQVEKKIQHLLLYRNRLAVSAKLAEIFV